MIIVWVLVVLFFAIVGFGVLFGAPYVPSLKADTRRMFDTFYKITPSDVVIDFGSGDGIVLREVSRRGARAIGYEINPILVVISRLLSWRDPRVKVKAANFWRTDFPSEVTLVYIFSVTRDGARLEKKLQKEANRLKKSFTVLCYGSPLPILKPSATFEAYFRYEITPLHYQ